MKRLMIISIIILLNSCKSDKPVIEEVGSNFDCPYKEILMSEISEECNNGSKISASLKVNLESNAKLIKKIGKGGVNLEFNDTTILNDVHKQISKKTLYSTGFLETHNSIIQILCSIEKDLQDTTISSVTRDALMNEKIKRRTDYFNFLLENRDSITSGKKEGLKIRKPTKRIENSSRSEGQKSGITANKVNVPKTTEDEDNFTTLNKVTSINQQGGITANEVHIHEIEKKPELTRENLDFLFQEALNINLPQSYPSDGKVNVSTILHNETLLEFKRYEEKGWLDIQSTGSVSTMGVNNRIGNSIEDKKRPWGMGSGFVISLNRSIYEE